MTFPRGVDMAPSVNPTKYDDWPVWKLWLVWAWSFVKPGNDEWQTIGSVIERKTAAQRRKV